MSKRILQVVTALFGVGTALTGIGGMLGLDNPTYAALGLPASHVLDNNLRFYGGIWMGLGIAAIWLSTNIEKQTALFRTIWGAIFLGGIGRVFSMLMLGEPPAEFIGYAALEVIGAPLMIYWQYRVVQDQQRVPGGHP